MGLLENDILTVRSYKYQKSHAFECLMPIVGIADPIKVSHLVKKVNYSDYEMSGVQGMRYGAYQAFFAGFMSKKNFSMIFNETQDQDVKRYFNAWRQLIVDNHGRFKKKKGFLFGYSKPIFLNYLNNKGTIVNVVEFTNSFPVSYSPSSLSYDESGIQQVEVTFVCDKIREIRDLIANPIEDAVTSLIPEILVPAANKSATPGL